VRELERRVEELDALLDAERYERERLVAALLGGRRAVGREEGVYRSPLHIDDAPSLARLGADELTEEMWPPSMQLSVAV